MVRVAESSKGSNKKLKSLPAFKQSRKLGIQTNSTWNYTQSDQVDKVRQTKATKVNEVKRTGRSRSKKSQLRDTELTPVQVLLTDLVSVVSPVVIKNNRIMIDRAVQCGQDMLTPLSKVKPLRNTSLNSQARVSRNNISLTGRFGFCRPDKKTGIDKETNDSKKKNYSFETFFGGAQSSKTSEFQTNIKNTAAFSNADSIKNSSRKIQIREKTFKTSSLLFEGTQDKEMFESKRQANIQSVSPSMSYVQQKSSNLSFNTALEHMKTSPRSDISAGKSIVFERSALMKDDNLEIGVPQMRNHISYEKQNKQVRSKLGNRKTKSRRNFHNNTAGTQFSKLLAEGKVKKLRPPISDKTVDKKSQKLLESLPNDHTNFPFGKIVTRSHSVKKELKQTSTHKKKSVSNVASRNKKQYNPRQKIQSQTRTYLHRNSNRPLQSLEYMPSLAINSSLHKSLKPSTDTPQTRKQREKFQRKSFLKDSNLPSTTGKKNYRQSDVSFETRSIDGTNSLQPTPGSAGIPNKASSSIIRNQVPRISAIIIQKNLVSAGKKTSRLSDSGKKRKSTTNARNVTGLSYRNTDGNFEVKNHVAETKHSNISRPKRSSVNSYINKEQHVTSSVKANKLSLSKGSRKAPHKLAGRRVGKKQSLSTLPDENITDNKEASNAHKIYSVRNHMVKLKVDDLHSNTESKLGVKLTTSKLSPDKQITKLVGTAVDEKFNLNYPERKCVSRTLSRQEVTGISSLDLKRVGNLAGGKKSRKSAPGKTQPLKNSVKKSPILNTRISLPGITTNIFKIAEVQSNSVATPSPTKTLKPVTLVSKIQQDLPSAPPKKRIAKAVHAKLFVSDNHPMLSYKVERNKSVLSSLQKAVNVSKITDVEMVNQLSLGESKALRLLRKTTKPKVTSLASSQNLTGTKVHRSRKYPELSSKVKERKSAIRTPNRASSNRIKRIELGSPGQKKSEYKSGKCKPQRAKSPAPPNKIGNKRPCKVASKIQVNTVRPKLSKGVKTTAFTTASVRVTRQTKNKEIKRIDFSSPGEKQTTKTLSLGRSKITTKSSSKKKVKKVVNQTSGRTLSNKLSSISFQRRQPKLSSPKIRIDSEAVEGEKNSLVIPEQNKESQLPLSLSEIQKPSFSVQKKAQEKKLCRKVSEKVLSNSSKQVTRKSVIKTPKLTRLSKVKLNCKTVETLEASPGRFKLQKPKLVIQKKMGEIKTPQKVSRQIFTKKGNSKLLTRVTRKSFVTPTKIARRNKAEQIVTEQSVIRPTKMARLGKIKQVSTEVSVVTPTKIARLGKAKNIGGIFIEHAKAPEPLSSTLKIQKILISTSRNKTGKRLETPNEMFLYTVSPKLSTKTGRAKSVTCKQAKCQEMKNLDLVTSGSKEVPAVQKKTQTEIKVKKTPGRRHTNKVNQQASLKMVALKSLQRTERVKLNRNGKNLRNKRALQKKTVQKLSEKKIPSKKHSSKANPKLSMRITAHKSVQRNKGILNKGRENLSNSLVPQQKIDKSIRKLKHMKITSTDFLTNMNVGSQSEVSLQTVEIKSTQGASNVSNIQAKPMYTWNKLLKTPQLSRNIGTVQPFNLVRKNGNNETGSQFLKRAREKQLKNQAQHFCSTTREVSQTSSIIAEHIGEGLGRRSLWSSEITDSYCSQPVSWKLKMTVPLDAEVSGSSYERKDMIASFSEEARAKSFVFDVRGTRNIGENVSPVRRMTILTPTSIKNVSCTEHSRNISNVAFTSPIVADQDTRYTTSTPNPVLVQSIVSSVNADSTGNIDTYLETIRKRQSLMSYKHNSATDLRVRIPLRKSYMMSERSSGMVNEAKEYRVQTGTSETNVCREIEESKELKESLDTINVNVEEERRDDSIFVSQNSHEKQCIIS